jgi:hypothetical protein
MVKPGKKSKALITYDEWQTVSYSYTEYDLHHGRASALTPSLSRAQPLHAV